VTAILFAGCHRMHRTQFGNLVVDAGMIMGAAVITAPSMIRGSEPADRGVAHAKGARDSGVRLACLAPGDCLALLIALISLRFVGRRPGQDQHQDQQTFRKI
jgi:hypothetical protein